MKRDMHLRPGEGFQQFVIKKQHSTISGGGRIRRGDRSSEKSITGILTAVDQDEKIKWKQQNHTITHKIVQYGAIDMAEPNDYLVGNERYFRVKGIGNPGDLGHTVIYYVEESADTNAST